MNHNGVAVLWPQVGQLLFGARWFIFIPVNHDIPAVRQSVLMFRVSTCGLHYDNLMLLKVRLEPNVARDQPLIQTKRFLTNLSCRNSVLVLCRIQVLPFTINFVFSHIKTYGIQ